MAEFVEVMKQRDRMCKSFGNGCGGCKLSSVVNRTHELCHDYMINSNPEEVEKIIMEWAAAHPEQKYPSWNEAWKQLFPDAFSSIHSADNVAAPCLQYFMRDCRYESCNECREQPIPADIAEKLGIKPLEG